MNDYIKERVRVLEKNYIKGHPPVPNAHYDVQEAESWVEGEPEEFIADIRTALTETWNKSRLDAIQEEHGQFEKAIRLCEEMYGRGGCGAIYDTLRDALKKRAATLSTMRQEKGV